jgi:hypothetical protein
MSVLMADKSAQPDDPRTVRLYRLLDELVGDRSGGNGADSAGVDDERLRELADLMAEIAE